MQTVQSSPMIGYYTNGQPTIGQRGDFITSPEVSQLFGEVIGCHLASKMEQKRYVLFEMGAGRGTLLADILRTFKQLHVFDRVESIVFLECSPSFQRHQRDVAESYGLSPTFIGSMRELPRKSHLIAIAHEFFDALPVHLFKHTSPGGWREVLVDYARDDEQFKMAVSCRPTTASSFLQINKMFPSPPAQESTTVELSPDSWRIANDLAKMARGSHHFLSLIIDYGQDGPSAGSLRAIKGHRLLSTPFDSVGEADLSVNVDFRAIRHYFRGCRSRLQTQREFLLENGIQERARAISSANSDIEPSIKSETDRLTGSMGDVYRVLSIERVS